MNKPRSTKSSAQNRNYKIAMAALFSALSIVLSVTPLGYITVGGVIHITLVHIPAILAAFLGGLVPGIATGFVFGLTSMIKNLMTGMAIGPFFMNPLVSVVPRMIFPMIAWGIYVSMNMIPHMPRTVSAVLGAAVATFCHTVLVMGAICLLYSDIYIPMVTGTLETLGFDIAGASGFKAFCIIIAFTLVTNGAFEILSAAVVSAVVIGAVRIAGHRRAKLSRIEDSVGERGDFADSDSPSVKD